jgi:hypothetical protein
MKRTQGISAINLLQTPCLQNSLGHTCNHVLSFALVRRSRALRPVPAVPPAPEILCCLVSVVSTLVKLSVGLMGLSTLDRLGSRERLD